MEISEDKYLVHLNPILRDEADFIINAIVEDDEKRYEQLWVKMIDDDVYRVCCIPFFLYDIALGDVVSTKRQGDKLYLLDKVIEKSGHHSFRIWFTKRPDISIRDDIRDSLIKMGVKNMELHSESLLAVDVENGKLARIVQDYLQEQQSTGRVEFENGETHIDF